MSDETCSGIVGIEVWVWLLPLSIEELAHPAENIWDFVLQSKANANGEKGRGAAQLGVGLRGVKDDN